jgi:hypothetical protein
VECFEFCILPNATISHSIPSKQKTFVMKTTKSIFLFFALFVFSAAYGDIIPDNSHYVTKCVKISNIEDYPQVSLVACVIGVDGKSFDNSYLISSTSCLGKGYKLNHLLIYAVCKDYLTGKDIEKLDLTKDYNAIPANCIIDPYEGYISNSNPLNFVGQYYKIIGFSGNTIVLFKWKEVFAYNNGKSDSTQIFNTTNNQLSQNFPDITKIKPVKADSKIELFPNPTSGSFSLKVDNNYYGKVNVKIFSLDGKNVHNKVFEKTSATDTFTINEEELAKGTYFVKIQIGELSETKKILVN